ncbi:bifunctional 3-(3-hydroxy-phenyl)propionate/3-hydroxycinnamic acid hydroxylase [Kocuria sp.]|uniref:bifunctional 3-(3-hydroxy-phenyl)propionate/3-hydroxycinnamic acid hydroxylase n=1 Tax=Kocuria sp. TaxID=1871328 RepID=UPI0025C24482|nr:bifunctional 3-(3-hydroxy-phenyl)propionate/3-hydroxycinnamic acid hydroxylase [Kocuria sp.]
MSGPFDVDVVVVGGGPVGVAALAMLGQVGLTAVGLERDTEMWPTARAVHFDGEAFRALQALGVADALADATLPMSSMHIQNEDGEVLVSVPTGRFGTQAWHDDLTFHQPDVERVLRDVVDDTPGVELRCGVTVTRVANVADGVEVSTVDADGSTTTLRARWVIAADGARSSIRHAIGGTAEKFGHDAQWVVVDGHLVDSEGYEDDMIFLCHHTRPAMWIRRPGTRVRMEFMLLDGDDPEEIVTPAAIERISRGILPQATFTAERQALYTFRGRIAERWRDGNIFLAGDAAHLAPPCFGQGLCAGIRDVANLVWKLDLVKRGAAAPALLDSYETERKPHARFWVEQAVTAAGFLQTTDPGVARQRDAYIRANPLAAAPVSPPLGPGLHEGDRDDRAGRLSVQPLLKDGVRLDDMVGLHFVVAVPSALYTDLDPVLRTQLESSGDVVVLLDPAKIDPILDGAGARAVVIRPDRYILGAADSAQDLGRLIRMIPGVTVPEPQNA